MKKQNLNENIRYQYIGKSPWFPTLQVAPKSTPLCLALKNVPAKKIMGLKKFITMNACCKGHKTVPKPAGLGINI